MSQNQARNPPPHSYPQGGNLLNPLMHPALYTAHFPLVTLFQEGNICTQGRSRQAVPLLPALALPYLFSCPSFYRFLLQSMPSHTHQSHPHLWLLLTTAGRFNRSYILPVDHQFPNYLTLVSPSGIFSSSKQW